MRRAATGLTALAALVVVTSPGSPWAGRARAAERIQSWIAVPAPDMDGDEIADVLDYRYREPEKWPFAMVLRSGATGRERWRYESEMTYSRPFLAYVGPAGEPGIGLVEIDSADPSNSYVSAFTSDGRQLFDTHVGRMNNAPILSDVLPGRPGHATELLLSEVPANPGPVPSFEHTFTVSGISLADGTITPRGQPIPGTPAIYGVRAVGDMTGDGLADFAVHYNGVDSYAQQPMRLRLRSRAGVDLGDVTVGGNTWTPFGDVGDVTGDGLDDIAVNSATPPPYHIAAYITPEPTSIAVAYEDERLPISLVDVGAGRVAWTMEGGTALRAGDLTGDSVDDLVVLDVRHDGDVLRLEAHAVRGDRSPIYAAELATRPRQQFGGAEIYDVGDVDGDRTPDLLYRLTAGDETKPGAYDSITGLHDGSTGRLLRREPGLPLHGSLDGTGADLVRSRWDPKTRRGSTDIVDGRTGKRLARVDFRGPGYPWPVYVRDVDRDGCADVVAQWASDRGRYTAAFSVLDGTRHWREDHGSPAPPPDDVTVTRTAPLCGRPLPATPPRARPIVDDELPATGGGVPTALGLLTALSVLGAGALRRRRAA